MRDSALDLIEDEEFENYFVDWKNVYVYNEVTKTNYFLFLSILIYLYLSQATPELNDKNFKELPSIVRQHIVKKKKAGTTICTFIQLKRSKLLAIK